MAYLAYNPNLDPNKKNDPNDPQNISGESTSFNQAPPGAPASLPEKKASGQYTNIQAYLGANTEQAANMGNTITQNVEDKSVQAQDDISKLASEKPNTAAVDPNKYLANPVASDAVEYKALKDTGGYTGPSDLAGTQNYKNAYGSASAADSLVKATGTEEGRMTLLQDQYKRPNYSRGLQTLDQALLQNDPTSKQKFADINQKYSGISSLFNTTATDVGNAINSSKQNALANKQSIMTAEEKAWNDLINPIQARATQQTTDNAALYDRVKDDAKDSTLNDESLAALGLSAGQNTYGLNVGGYVNGDKTPVGLNNAANTTERERYAALNALINDQSRNQLTLDGKAITPVQFDKVNFDKDVAKKAAEYNNAYSTQTGTILNPEFIGGYDYAQQIPGNLTSRRDLNSATPKDIEEFWIPLFKQAAQGDWRAEGAYGPTRDGLIKSLDAWKATYNPSAVITKG